MDAQPRVTPRYIDGPPIPAGKLATLAVIRNRLADAIAAYDETMEELETSESESPGSDEERRSPWRNRHPGRFPEADTQEARNGIIRVIGDAAINLDELHAGQGYRPHTWQGTRGVVVDGRLFLAVLMPDSTLDLIAVDASEILCLD